MKTSFLKLLQLFLVFGIIVALLTACSKNDIKTTTLDILTPLSSDDSPAAAALIKGNIVKIENTMGNSKIVGTGFFDSSGYLVTNSHVVDIAGKLQIIYPDGSTDSAQLVANNVNSDIAILAVNSPKCKAMSFSQTAGLRETDTLFGAGFAYNLEGSATVTKGVLSARRTSNNIEYLQTDAPLSPGCSGGPLFDSRGRLVGMITLASESASIGMAISADCLRNIIDKLIASPFIEYISGTRPENALSTVLKSIGYRVDDLYGEEDALETRNHSENSDKPNSSASSESNGSSQNTSSSKANGGGTNSRASNAVSNSVTSSAPPVITRLDGLAKILPGGVTPRRSQRLGISVIEIQFFYADSEGAIFDNFRGGILSSIKVTVFHGYSHDGKTEINGHDLRELFQVDLSSDDIAYAQKSRTIEMPIDRIRQNLTHEDYSGSIVGDGNLADITYMIEFTTKEQGVFKAFTYSHLQENS